MARKILHNALYIGRSNTSSLSLPCYTRKYLHPNLLTIPNFFDTMISQFAHSLLCLIGQVWVCNPLGPPHNEGEYSQRQITNATPSIDTDFLLNVILGNGPTHSTSHLLNKETYMTHSITINSQPKQLSSPISLRRDLRPLLLKDKGLAILAP